MAQLGEIFVKAIAVSFKSTPTSLRLMSRVFNIKMIAMSIQLPSGQWRENYQPTHPGPGTQLPVGHLATWC